VAVGGKVGTALGRTKGEKSFLSVLRYFFVAKGKKKGLGPIKKKKEGEGYFVEGKGTFVSPGALRYAD